MFPENSDEGMEAIASMPSRMNECNEEDLVSLYFSYAIEGGFPRLGLVSTSARPFRKKIRVSWRRM